MGFRLGRPRFSLLALPAAMLSILAFALADADAASPGEPTTEVKTVPAELVFENKNEPGDAGHCSAIAFVKWQDVPNTLSATVFYAFNGKEESKTKKSPFDDYYTWVADYTAPIGSHWIEVSKSWVDGGVPNDCSVPRGKMEGFITAPVRAELTVEVQEEIPQTDPAACEAARKQLKARNKAVSKLRRKVKNANGKQAKARARAKLKKAQKARAKAVQKVAKEC